jgi:2',3'-cyclic-nucleotide 2'-phosphodiesterase (5'-nucleotidase family)
MRKLILGILLLAISAVSSAGEKWQLTIAHTNDLHGWMMPFDYQTSNARFTQSEFVDGRFAAPDAGGLARRATMITALRRTTTHPLAVIDAGDLFTRGPWHKSFFGTPEIEAYNQMGYDMACIGNNEFKATAGADSQAILLGLMRQSRFPWLCANLTVGETGVPVEGIRPFIVRRYGAMRVGFLGLTAPRSKDYPQTKGWTIGDPIEAATQWAPIARKECDVLIAVTHIGVDLDKQLAARVAGIDAIIGGDSHTFVPAPIVVISPNGSRVPIVQAGAYGVRLGRLDLTFEKLDGWRLVQYSGKLIRVDGAVKEDPAVSRALAQWIAPPAATTTKLRPQPLRARRTLPAPVRRTPARRRVRAAA